MATPAASPNVSSTVGLKNVVSIRANSGMMARTTKRVSNSSDD